MLGHRLSHPIVYVVAVHIPLLVGPEEREEGRRKAELGEGHRSELPAVLVDVLHKGDPAEGVEERRTVQLGGFRKEQAAVDRSHLEAGIGSVEEVAGNSRLAEAGDAGRAADNHELEGDIVRAGADTAVRSPEEAAVLL